MDKTDAEILWALKQSTSYQLRTDLLKKNPRLSDSSIIKEHLRFLEEDGMVESRNIPSLGVAYIIKKKGNDLFWTGKTKNRILNLLNISDIEYNNLYDFFSDIDSEELKKEIGLMTKEIPPLVKSYTTEHGKFYHITSVGESYISNKNQSTGSTNIGQINQYNIGQINIQNFQNVIDQILIEVDKEPNLNEKEKEDLKKLVKEESGRLTKIKEELAKYGGKFVGQTLRTFAGLPEE